MLPGAPGPRKRPAFAPTFELWRIDSLIPNNGPVKGVLSPSAWR